LTLPDAANPDIEDATRRIAVRTAKIKSRHDWPPVFGLGQLASKADVPHCDNGRIERMYPATNVPSDVGLVSDVRLAASITLTL
jgi:hypothetical protein